MARKKSKLDVAVARTANILEAHLATLPALRREPLKKKEKL
jgi:hypothetical protein